LKLRYGERGGVRLNAEVMVWLVLAMGIFTTYTIRSVFRASQRFKDALDIPGRSALSKTRKRLGINPLRLLCKNCGTPVRSRRTGGILQRLAVDGNRWRVVHMVVNTCQCGCIWPSPRGNFRGNDGNMN
jgi:hypothetical protein